MLGATWHYTEARVKVICMSVAKSFSVWSAWPGQRVRENIFVFACYKLEE